MPDPSPDRIRPFATEQEFDEWLTENHGEPELWLQIFKKTSQVRTISWAEAVSVALRWGWIDGIKKGHDDLSFLQRFCPRKKASLWSMANRREAERLIAEGLMRAPGLAAIEDARANGRWDRAYLGASEAETPQDFLDALKTDTAARQAFRALSAAKRYAIYFRLQTATSETVRERRKASLLEKLRRGETEL